MYYIFGKGIVCLMNRCPITVVFMSCFFLHRYRYDIIIIIISVPHITILCPKVRKTYFLIRSLVVIIDIPRVYDQSASIAVVIYFHRIHITTLLMLNALMTILPWTSCVWFNYCVKNIIYAYQRVCLLISFI